MYIFVIIKQNKNMNIKTKFGINDLVYTFDTKAGQMMKGYIDDIDINISRVNEDLSIYIRYTIGDRKFLERDLFTSLEEAFKTLSNEIAWIQ